MSEAELAKWIVEGNEKAALETLEMVLREGVAPQKIIDGPVLKGLDKVGELFSQGEYYIPEMLQSAHVVQRIVAVLKPHLASDNKKERKTKVVLGTVKGDLHDIGKNIVGMFLEGGGFQVIDLGRDVSTQQFLEAIEKERPDIVGLSALLTTTMPAMRETVGALRASKALGAAKVIVGGSPVTADFAKKIGADEYGKDAVDALRVVRSLTAS